MNNFKIMRTFISTSIKLDKDISGKSINVKQYRDMISSLLYITTTHPNIMFSVCMCTKFQANPKQSHLYAIKRILKYLKGTINMGLFYLRGISFELTSYSNADFGGCKLGRKSTSGTCHFLRKSLVSWASKKQNSCDNLNLAYTLHHSILMFMHIMPI